jgi:vesicle transport through interaction with t-SNAREs 1
LVSMSYFVHYCIYQVSIDQGGRMLMTIEKLNQSTDRIKESQKTLLDTEDLGVSILQDIH